MSIQSLGYIGVSSTDLAQWQQFACSVLGLEDVTARLSDPAGAHYYKMDDHPYRLMVEQGETDKLLLCGWETNNQAGLHAVADALSQAGVKFEWASHELAKQRRVTELLRFTDPSGTQHEVFWGVISDFRHLNSPVGVGGFITGEQGMGHVVIPTADFDATAQFFVQVLGFGLSDLMNITFTNDPNEPNEPVKRLWFLHCNSRHHSLGLFEMPMPAGCVHLMLEVPDVDQVGLCNDRRIAAGVKLTGTLGRHANDHMVSFYMRSPAGFDIEYGAEGRTISDWSQYAVFESTAASFWGHDFSVGHQD